MKFSIKIKKKKKRKNLQFIETFFEFKEKICVSVRCNCTVKDIKEKIKKISNRFDVLVAIF